MIEFYFPLLLMSVVTATLYLILKLSSKWTQKYFSATWHYYSHVLLYTLFFIPYFKLLSFLNPNILDTVRRKLELHIIAPIQHAIRESSGPMADSDAGGLIAAERIGHETDHFISYIWHVIPYVWIAGTIVFLAVVTIQNIKIHRRIFAICEVTGDPDILRELSDGKRQLGITDEIPVYLSPCVSSPFLYGMFKPRIVLPATIEFTAEEYRQIFLHELTHYRRRDIGVKGLLLCVNALHWFNPLAYMARRDADRYGELSCDERIVRTMDAAERKRYCELLLNVLWNVADQRGKLYSAFSDKRNYLERRIHMILNHKGAERRKSVRLLAMMAALLLAVFGMSAVYAAVSAHDASLKSERQSDIKSECALVSEIRTGIGPVAVEVVTTSSEYFNTYDEIKPGECKRFGGYTLHKGDVVSPNYAYTGGDLQVYLLEYDARTLEDGILMGSGANYTIPEDGHYYFLLRNTSQHGKSSVNVEMSVPIQVNS
ncbi:BlaR1 peptidase M56 [Paenibacillus sp. 32O-W]|uniref:M56 family metallopeptidase n=1 Tax=Paenibacillus sp. 32O-W TaxID=1695218 RepID=UPI00071FE8C8|nr:M56 family metallopeptidase [Paenibacillus sp. 32O-W]ALS28554.1 BlaR1 peptidase M56 [Paenibacillus sp. 32O-W]